MDRQKDRVKRIWRRKSQQRSSGIPFVQLQFLVFQQRVRSSAFGVLFVSISARKRTSVCSGGCANMYIWKKKNKFVTKWKHRLHTELGTIYGERLWSDNAEGTPEECRNQNKKNKRKINHKISFFILLVLGAFFASSSSRSFSPFSPTVVAARSISFAPQLSGWLVAFHSLRKTMLQERGAFRFLLRSHTRTYSTIVVFYNKILAAIFIFFVLLHLRIARCFSTFRYGIIMG